MTNPPREFVKRLLKRALPVALILAGLGYLYARLFLLILHPDQPTAGGSTDFLWRLPVTFGLIGFVFMLIAEAIVGLARRKPPVDPPAPPDTIGSTNPPRDS